MMNDNYDMRSLCENIIYRRKIMNEENNERQKIPTDRYIYHSIHPPIDLIDLPATSSSFTTFGATILVIFIST